MNQYHTNPTTYFWNIFNHHYKPLSHYTLILSHFYILVNNYFWRGERELNSRKWFCRPLHNHSGITSENLFGILIAFIDQASLPSFKGPSSQRNREGHNSTSHHHIWNFRCEPTNLNAAFSEHSLCEFSQLNLLYITKGNSLIP